MDKASEKTGASDGIMHEEANILVLGHGH